VPSRTAGHNYQIDCQARNIKKIAQNISSISVPAADDCANLRQLYLDENHLQMEDMRRLSKLAHLETLNVSDNRIRGIFDLSLLSLMSKLKVFWAFDNGVTAFRNSLHKRQTSAKIFDFSNNKLTAVDLKLFDGFAGLEFLNLERNMIVSLDGYASVRTYLPMVLEVTLEENEWSCKRLKKILDVFEKEKIKAHLIEETSCYDHKNYLLDHICCNNVTLH
jgi:hypothetical protein